MNLEGLKALKKAMAKAFPQVPSSYLTEAIAYSLGFKTNAALRATLAAGGGVPDIVDAARFAERLKELESRT